MSGISVRSYNGVSYCTKAMFLNNKIANKLSLANAEGSY